MAVAATVISMLAHVAAHRYGFEFWGIRTTAMVDSQARVLHWAVTGGPPPTTATAAPSPPPAPARSVGGGARPGPHRPTSRRLAARKGRRRLPARLPGWAARRAAGYLTATGLSGEPRPLVNGSGVASRRKV